MGVLQSHQFTVSILWLIFQTDRKEEILEFQLHHNDWISRRCYFLFFIWDFFLFLYKQDFMGLFHKQQSLSQKMTKNLHLIGYFYERHRMYRPICGNFVGMIGVETFHQVLVQSPNDRIMDPSTRIHRCPMEIHIKLGASSPLP